MNTSRLSHLYDDPGPFATVMLDVSRDNETGEHGHELRVRAAAEERDQEAQGNQARAEPVAWAPPGEDG
jgi:hypothetical protein